jgi:hypothetical protein
MHISAKEGQKELGTGTLEVAAATVMSRRMRPTLGTLKGNDLERRSDPRLLRLPRNLVRCAVIFSVVALHEKLPGSREFETSLFRPVQLERNAGGSERQCVPPRDSY